MQDEAKFLSLRIHTPDVYTTPYIYNALLLRYTDVCLALYGIDQPTLG